MTSDFLLGFILGAGSATIVAIVFLWRESMELDRDIKGFEQYMKAKSKRSET